VVAPASPRPAATTAAASPRRPLRSCYRRRCAPPAPATTPCGRSPLPWRSRSPCPPGLPRQPQLLSHSRLHQSNPLGEWQYYAHLPLETAALIKQVLLRSKQLGGGAWDYGTVRECHGVWVNLRRRATGRPRSPRS
jgi:hypothetical protein